MPNQNFYPNQRRVTNHKKMKNGRIDGAGGSMIIAYWADVCLVVKRTGNPLCGLLWEYFFKNQGEWFLQFYNKREVEILPLNQSIIF